MIQFHLQGGIIWMAPLSILLLILLGLIFYVGYQRATGKTIHSKWMETIRHTGQLALAWGVFSEVVGLFAIFEDLQSMGAVPPLPMFMGGLKALVIALLYALLIFIISLLAYLILR